MPIRILFLLTVLLATSGCLKKAPPDLRLDDLTFGNKRIGRTAENPVFKPGEEFDFGYKQRGATPDGESQAKISLSAKLSHEDQPFHELEEESYKWNSELTSYGPRGAVTGKIPEDAKGPGTLEIVLTDHVADRSVTITRSYTVE